MMVQTLSLRAQAPSASLHNRPTRQQRRLVAVRAAEQQPEGEPSSSTTAAPPPPQPPSKDVCPTCGVALDKKAFGCDGTGRIAGGIGAVPFMQWWPIKAYRPCPKLAEAGMAYRRKGQITDEMLFGRGRQQ